MSTDTDNVKTTEYLRAMKDMPEALKTHLNASIDEQLSICHWIEVMEDKMENGWEDLDSDDDSPAINIIPTSSPWRAQWTTSVGTQDKPSAGKVSKGDLIKLANMYKVPEFTFTAKAIK
jgi:hypothetical protein